MIDLTGKSVFVRTQEEYSKVLRIAKLQGFRWARGKHLNAIDIPLPNMLNFYDERIVTYSSDERKMYEASEIVACEKKLEEAMAHVKYFANNKDRMSLTDKVIESMLLLANTVESQLEEVKQMERLTLEEAINHEKMMAQRKRWNGKFTKVSLGNEEINKRFEADCIKDAEEHEQFAEWLEELKSYKEAEEQGLLVRLPVKIGDDIYRITSKANYDLNVLNGYKVNNRVYHQKVYSIVFSQSGWLVQCDKDSIYAPNVICVDVEYGKTWFLTREEAEKKLEEMKK